MTPISINILFTAICIAFGIGCTLGAAIVAFEKLREPKVKSYKISTEQLNDWVKQFYGQQKDYPDFCEFISDWLNGKVPPAEMENGALAEVSEDCRGNECPSFVTREDCCNCLGKDNKCHFVINLNEVCGIHSSVKEICSKPDLLSQEEINLLTAALVENMKKEETNATKR